MDADLFPVGVGQDHPRHVALTEVERPRAEPDQPLHLGRQGTTAPSRGRRFSPGFGVPEGDVSSSTVQPAARNIFATYADDAS